MKLVNLIEEDFTNYKKPGIFLGFPLCSGKCNKDALKVVCQNQALRGAKLIDISAEEIIDRYSSNPITKCLICGGLEPFDSMDDLIDICKKWSEKFYRPDSLIGRDKIVIYTGYYPFEIVGKIMELNSKCNNNRNIIIKYGRFIPGCKPHKDPILGVDLASDNQYAEFIGHTLYKYV